MAKMNCWHLSLVAMAALLFGKSPVDARPFDLKSGDRVAFIGDALIEADQEFAFLEIALATRFPDRDVTFRNIGWSGDTPAGISRAGLSPLQAGSESPEEGFKQLKKQLQLIRPTVLIAGYGNSSSFDGEAGVEKFRTEYERLIAAAQEAAKPDEARFVFLGPTRSAPAYKAVIESLAKKLDAPFINLDGILASKVDGKPVTIDGLRLNGEGYRLVARAMEKDLGWPQGKWETGAEADRLRKEIIRKNELFFHRSRPANMAYIFGFRRGEQGRNAVEIPQFDPLVTALEERIAKLRTLKPTELPESPARTKSAYAKFTPQPAPSFTLAEGLEITLWAENPLLFKPTQINFDPKGRLWVASSEVYPQVEPGQTANDKILILEDTKGQGKADKSTVFADGLLIPTGLEPGDDGVYVAQSTELLHFREKDGKVERRTILSGFGTEDTHHNLHTLRWGPDGRLYMNQSIYTRTDAETPHGVTRLRSGGTFAFDPQGHRMEILYRGWVNSWGHAFDRFGQSFLTDGAGGDGVSYGMPGAMYTAYAGARRLLGSVSPGGYPKFCSLETVESSHFPDNWQGDLVTCDFRANRIVRFKLSDDGSGFQARQVEEIVRANQASFRPIDVKLGPDGALYVADWSNPIINHGEVDFRDPRRDREHGRIWRISVKGRPSAPRRDFTSLKTGELMDSLLSKSGYDRRQARRVLAERGVNASDIDAWVARQGTDEARLESLWLREAVHANPNAARTAALEAKTGPVRAAALRRASDHQQIETALKDDHPRVRLEAIRALSHADGDPSARLDAALSVLNKPMDRFLDYGLWLTANELAGPWLEKLANGEITTANRGKEIGFVLSAVEPAKASRALTALLAKNPIPSDGSGPWMELIAASGGPQELRALFDLALGGNLNEPTTARALQAMVQASQARKARPAGDLAGIAKFLDSTDDATRNAALALVGRWGLTGLATKVRDIASDTKNPLPRRFAALEALREFRQPEANRLIESMAKNEAETRSLRQQAALAWLANDPQNAMGTAISLLGKEREYWQTLVTQPALSGKLAVEIRDRKLSPETASVGLNVLRSVGGRNANLERALVNLTGQPVKEYTAGDVQRVADLAVQAGNPARGEAVFRRAELRCLACHPVNGAGGKVGPDLMAIGASAPPDYIAESLLMPNAKIKEGYHAVNILTKAGKSISGIAVKDTPTELVLRDSENNEVTIAKDQIDERTQGQSLMPAGLMQPLFDNELHDLTRFLIEMGKPGPFDVTKTRSPRFWRIGSSNRTDGQSAPGGDELIYTTVAGDLPKAEIRNPAPTLELTTRFETTADGPSKFDLQGVKPQKVWIDGQEITAASALSPDLKRGPHTLVIQVRPADLPARWRVTAPDVVFRPD